MNKAEAARVLTWFNEMVSRIEPFPNVQRLLHGHSMDYHLVEQDDRLAFLGGSGDTLETDALANSLRLFYQDNDEISINRLTRVYETGPIAAALCSDFGALRDELNRYLDTDTDILFRVRHTDGEVDKSSTAIRYSIVLPDESTKVDPDTDSDIIVANKTYRLFLETYLYGDLTHLVTRADFRKREEYEFFTSNALFGMFGRMTFDNAIQKLLTTLVAMREVNERALIDLSK